MIKERTLLLFMAIGSVAARPAPSLNGWRDGGVSAERRAARRIGLRPFADRASLRAAVARGLLVSIPERGAGYVLDSRIGELAGGDRLLYRTAFPTTGRFIRWFARRVSRQRGDTVRVTSLVRTRDYQRRLRRINGNAAESTSSHEFGTTVDFSKIGIQPAALCCARALLLGAERRGVVLATEETAQSVFHVMVFPSFRPYNDALPAACNK